MPRKIVDTFNVEGEDYSIEPVIDAVPVEGSQHAVMGGGVYSELIATRGDTPVASGPNAVGAFTRKGAYDYFDGAENPNDFYRQLRPRGKLWHMVRVSEYCVAYGATANFPNGVFVAVPRGSRSTRPTFYSEDGLHWTEGSGITLTRQDGSVYNICYGNGMFIIGGYNSGIFYSEDAINWYQGTGIATNKSVFKPTYGNGVFVAGGQDMPYWSEDGKDWTRGTDSTGYGYLSSSAVDWLQFVNGVFYGMLTPNGGIGNRHPVYSLDGETWYAASDIGGAKFIVYDNGRFMCETESDVKWSEDGVNWTVGVTFATANVANTGYFPCFCNGRWYVGTYSEGLYYSTDNGATWTHAANGLADQSSYCGVCVAGGVVFIRTGSTYKRGYAETQSTFTVFTPPSALIINDEGSGIFFLDNGIWWSKTGLWSEDCVNWFSTGTGIVNNYSTRSDGMAFGDTAIVVLANNAIWCSTIKQYKD